jgi:glycolate oxidase FAD binding subunit
MAHAEVSRTMLEMSALVASDRIRRPRGLELGAAETVVEPESVAELAELVRKCEIDRLTVAPIGASRTLSAIRLRPVEIGISLSRIASIEAYEPADMTVVADAGVTLDALNAQMATNGQQLPLDPCEPARTTIGSLIGAAHAGPMRLSEGLVRDLILGIEFVGHGGRVVHGGGRVVKNVAGYDLMRLMTGSFGTLGVITKAAFKVRPRPTNEMMAAASFDQLEGAFQAASRLQASVNAAHLEVLGPSCELLEGMRGYLVVAGVCGNEIEIEHYKLKAAQAFAGRCRFVEGAPALAVYNSIRHFDLRPALFAAQISVAPGLLGNCIAEIAQVTTVDFVAYAGSGVARLVAGVDSGGSDPASALRRIRAAARSARGHMRILRAQRELLTEVAIFDQPNAGAFSLMRRLKQTFDPAGIFNPGCFAGGI